MLVSIEAMPSVSRLWVLVGFLGLGLKGANSGALHHYPHYNTSSCDTTTIEPPPTYETYTSESLTTITPTTVITTSTVEYSTIAPNWTITVSVPVTITVTATTSYFTTISTTIPTIIPTTVVMPTTIAPPISYSTLFTTVTTSEDECPTTCSLVASTVRLFFWPTSNDYTYPSTYVETDLDYTFTSPSVYIYISTIYGTNSLGRAGPSATNKVFALDLDQLSTIVPGEQVTQQLTLNDLHTDCPQSEDPAAIATTVPDGHCDFSLVAPQPVKQWALPCNGCGRLGLFDPPYAIPPLGGGIIGTTITTDVETTTFASTASPASGATSTIVSATTTTAVTQTTQTTETGTGGPSSTGDPTTGSSSTTSLTTIPTASASRVTGMCGAAWLLVTCFIILYL
ncbi:hypothetical protein F5Y09DRAFT_318008 [Xylaria sp. FL1042]|nr:hypothetical protein F5Y09DRAFT_318008 [Xylaria sp. FL1042]